MMLARHCPDRSQLFSAASGAGWMFHCDPPLYCQQPKAQEGFGNSREQKQGCCAHASHSFSQCIEYSQQVELALMHTS
jgi:hypothetical protein